MSADYSGDSYNVVKGLYTRADSLKDRIKIECNWCDAETAIFYDGRFSGMHDVDWLAIAIVHLTSDHPDRMSE